MLTEDFKMEDPKWTKESFAAEAAKTDIDVDYWGDPTENLFSQFNLEYPRSQDSAYEVDNEWVTVGLVYTESSDIFLFHHPGRVNQRDLAAELFLTNPDYYKSPSEISFQEINYYKLKK